jgi:acetyltransferase-like isoleucine patch superfamily enzyme
MLERVHTRAALARATHVGDGVVVVGGPRIASAGELLVGDGVRLVSRPEAIDFVVERGARVELGPRAVIGSGTTLRARGRISIGAGAWIGAGCLIDDDGPEDREIVVGEDARVDPGAILAAGTRIGRGEHVPAGAVAGGAASSRPPVEAERLREVVSHVLPAAGALPVDADLASVPGWGSLAALRVQVALENDLGVQLPQDFFARPRSLSSLLPLVARPSAPARPAPEDGDLATRGSLLERGVADTAGALQGLDARPLAWAAMRLMPEFSFPRVRAQLLRALGCRVDRRVAVLGRVHLVGPKGCARHLQIGSGSIIGPDATFALDAPITLGQNVSISPQVTLYTSTHPLGGSARRMKPEVLARPIVIEDGVWVGLGAMVLPGVRLGRGCVLAAGSVVNQDVAQNAVVAGNPATQVETLPDS